MEYETHPDEHCPYRKIQGLTNILQSFALTLGNTARRVEVDDRRVGFHIKPSLGSVDHITTRTLLGTISMFPLSKRPSIRGTHIWYF